MATSLISVNTANEKLITYTIVYIYICILFATRCINTLINILHL